MAKKRILFAISLALATLLYCAVNAEFEKSNLLKIVANLEHAIMQVFFDPTGFIK